MPSFTLFRPPSLIGALYGAMFAAGLLFLGGLLLYKGLTMAVDMDQLAPLLLGGVLLVLGCLFAYWAWGCSSLSYMVDRNALSIRWGSMRQVIPLSAIERLIPASDDQEHPHIEGVSWPGHHVGRGEVEGLGDVLFYSAHRLASEVLYVQTPTEVYAISVPDPVFFAQTVQSNQARGPLFEQRQAVHRWGIAAQSFWMDPQARLLAVLLVASFVAVLVYVLQTYPDLSQSVALRFPSLSGIVRVSDKSELLDIPRSAAGFMALNLVLAVFLHSWERMIGYVLLLSGIAIQVMLLVAAAVAVA